MPGPLVAQAGAPAMETQATPLEENTSSGSRSSVRQERQDGLVTADLQADLQADGMGSGRSSQLESPHQPETASSSSSACPPPESASADIQVRLNDDPALGFCVFALRRYEPGDVLYTERTALEATHDVYKEGPRDVHQIYRRLTDGRKQKLHGSFPHLAWANNVDPYEAAESRHLISSNITTKRVRVDNQLSAADHIRMRPDSALLLTEAAATAAAPTGGGEHQGAGGAARASSPGSPLARAVSVVFSSILSPLTKLSVYGSATDTANADALADAAAAAVNRLPPPTTRKAAQAETVAWFSRYAFRLDPQDAFPKTGQNHQAAVYLLTDLINHRCHRLNNCRVKTEMGKASLIAEKTILPGEELTIDYKKDIKDFVCRAECCAPAPSSS